MTPADYAERLSYLTAEILSGQFSGGLIGLPENDEERVAQVDAALEIAAVILGRSGISDPEEGASIH